MRERSPVVSEAWTGREAGRAAARVDRWERADLMRAVYYYW